MTTKYQQRGDAINWTNVSGGDYPANRLIKMGNTLGVTLQPIANGATGPVAIEGVFYDMPKVSAAVFVQGEKLVWDISANTNTGAFDDSAASPATGDVTGGAIAWVAGANTETTCVIKLTPGNTAIA